MPSAHANSFRQCSEVCLKGMVQVRVVGIDLKPEGAAAMAGGAGLSGQEK